MDVFKNDFNKIAEGDIQVPKIGMQADKEFFSSRPDLVLFHDALKKNMGPLFHHFCASIPHVFEECCRTGAAVQKIANSAIYTEFPPFLIGEIAGFDGAWARTILEYNQKNIRTLTTSPNKANQSTFLKLSRAKNAYFYLTDFPELTKEHFDLPPLRPFSDKFDLIFENNAFQFYGAERDVQFMHAKNFLKSDGLFLCMEKLIHTCKKEYKKRELLKDSLFKTRYFSEEEIQWKKMYMLTTMQSRQVDRAALETVLKKIFSNVCLIWNSTNFFEYIASDSLKRINQFLQYLGPHYIPEPFLCETLDYEVLRL